MNIVVLVALVIGLQIVIWIPIVIWLRRRSAAIRADLSDLIGTDPVVRPSETAQYEGASAPGYPAVANRGTIALTSRRLIFISITRKQVILDRSAIKGARQSHKFRRSASAGKPRMIIDVGNGEVAFIVADADAWIHDLA